MKSLGELKLQIERFSDESRSHPNRSRPGKPWPSFSRPWPKDRFGRRNRDRRDGMPFSG